MSLRLVKKPAVIVDLDGTLCNNSHRQHHLEKKPKDWKAFFEGMDDDPHHDWCFFLIETICYSAQIIYVTGREEIYRERTQFWLDSKLMGCGRPLFMRSAGDHRDDVVVKEELYRQHIEPHYDVKFCLDDRPKVARMWRSIGLVCLQCNDKEF